VARHRLFDAKRKTQQYITIRPDTVSLYHVYSIHLRSGFVLSMHPDGTFWLGDVPYPVPPPQIETIETGYVFATIEEKTNGQQ
jgi:hypothetical protein